MAVSWSDAITVCLVWGDLKAGNGVQVQQEQLKQAVQTKEPPKGKSGGDRHRQTNEKQVA